MPLRGIRVAWDGGVVMCFTLGDDEKWPFASLGDAGGEGFNDREESFGIVEDAMVRLDDGDGSLGDGDAGLGFDDRDGAKRDDGDDDAGMPFVNGDESFAEAGRECLRDGGAEA